MWTMGNHSSKLTHDPCSLRQSVLQPSPKSRNPVMHMTRFYIACTKTCPTENCGIDINELIKDLNQHNMYQLVQDVTLSPMFKNSTYTPSVKQIGWSPIVLNHKLRCLLGMLSDSGMMHICYPWQDRWESDSALSVSWYKHCSLEWGEPPFDSKDTLEELKRRAYKLKFSEILGMPMSTNIFQQSLFWYLNQPIYHMASTIKVAFTWGPFLDKNCYLLFTGSLDGTLTVWKVRQDPETKGISVEMVGVLPLLDGYCSPVTALCCHFVEANKYMLMVCFLDGRISNKVLIFNSSVVKIDSQHAIWDDADKIQVYSGGMLAKASDDLILTVIKGSFILVFKIDSSGELMTYEVINSQELLITGLADLSPTRLLITAYSGSMYILDVGKAEPALIKEQSSLRGNHYSCSGLALSKSKAVAVIPYSVKTNYDHLSMKELCHLLWCSVADFSELLSRISSHVGPLSDIWDSIDLLRIESVMNNNDDTWLGLSSFLGSISTEELDTMETDMLKKKLAVLRILQISDHNPINYGKEQLATIEEDMLELIMSCHVFKRITNASTENLSEFERRSFFLMKKWLEYIINRSKYSFTTTTASTLLEQFNLDTINNERELCIICESEIPTFKGAGTAKCIANHEIPRCCLSLVQCGTLAYYKCFNCDVIAHPDAVSDEDNCCIYCDNTFKFTEMI